MSKFNGNAITWFEVPTTDIKRAVRFYETLLDKKLIDFPGEEACFIFPHGEDAVAGALVHRPNHKPTSDGAMVYLNVDGELDNVLARAHKIEGTVQLPKTQIPAASATTPAWLTPRATTSACTAVNRHPQSSGWPIHHALLRDEWGTPKARTLYSQPMRRADRLFRIVQMLRSGRLKTAHALAERLQVSDRTIYRDVRDLQLAGQPIEGEAGVGYTLRREFDLPPLMFTPEELTAIVLGARLVKAWGGAESVAAANTALARIEAVLPPELAARLDAIAFYAPGFMMSMAHRRLLDRLHAACLSRTVLRFSYTRLADDPSHAEQRTVRPLALTFWSGVWTLAAWCETRNDFRTFRLDRIEQLDETSIPFTPRRGQRLEDLMKKVRADRKKAASTPSRPASASD